MKEVTLYNQEIEQTEGINGFTSIEIFSDGGTDEVWGNEDENCNPFSFSSLDASIDYSGIPKDLEKIIDTVKIDLVYDLPSVEVKVKKNAEKNSLHIKTDKPPTCEWIGMGIGWDGWQGKDLSGIVNNAAIEFMARVSGDAIYNIPIVFILEDYSANQCFATAGYLGIEAGEITNKWSKVIVPLSTFSYQVNKIDLTNIKQLLLQCYDKVDIYIDDIKIVEHKHNYKKISSTSLTVKDTALPIDIFSEKLNSAFGVNNNYCQNIKLSSDSDYAQGNYIDVNIDNDKCSWKKLGISWNNWLYSDLSKSIYGVYLEFDIKIDKFSSPKIFIEDYNGKKMALNLLKYIKEEKTNNWQKIKISLKDFPIKKSEIDLKRIKNISFDFSDKDKLKIDNIKFTN
ncbi:hypothetical protein OAV36_02350 [Flavobacteriales bacterium]|jgi:hypothetical protein|nr:hypothetical protein [Flavobacteriales bacterium]MDG1348413.1 hypothetical protein [Flavobacteriales bacterium]